MAHREGPGLTVEEAIARLRASGIGLEPAGDHRWVVRDDWHPSEPVVLLPEAEFREWAAENAEFFLVHLEEELAVVGTDDHNHARSLRLRRGPDGRVRLEVERDSL